MWESLGSPEVKQGNNEGYLLPTITHCVVSTGQCPVQHIWICRDDSTTKRLLYHILPQYNTLALLMALGTLSHTLHSLATSYNNVQRCATLLYFRPIRSFCWWVVHSEFSVQLRPTLNNLSVFRITKMKRVQVYWSVVKIFTFLTSEDQVTARIFQNFLSPNISDEQEQVTFKPGNFVS